VQAAGRQCCSLVPWPGSVLPPDLSVTCQLVRDGVTFSLRYRLAGELAGLALPEALARPERRDGLWQESCFEFFVKPAGGSGYWEGNISPAGHWNLYYFSDYRLGMCQETAVMPPVVRQERQARSLLLEVGFSFERLLTPVTPCCLALSAVVRTTAGQTSYWALNHPASQPDFHHRQGFIFSL